MSLLILFSPVAVPVTPTVSASWMIRGGAIPYVNAMLTAVLAPGNAPDWDDAGTAGTARWSGSIGVYADDRLVQEDSSPRLFADTAVVDELVQTRLEVPWSVGQLIQRGDVLQWTNRETGVAWTRIADDVLGTRLIGRVRVRLQDA